MCHIRRYSADILAAVLVGLIFLLLMSMNPSTAQAAAEEASHGHDIGSILPVWTVIPFAGILLSIALCPLLVPHFWHNHFGKVSAFWAVLFAVPFLFVYHGTALYEIFHIYLIDYIPFIILLWGLFTVAGGIVVGGSFKGTSGKHNNASYRHHTGLLGRHNRSGHGDDPAGVAGK
jgi:hypothetical protein